MMRFVILAISVILLIAVQSTWLAEIELFGLVKPDMILILVIAYGLYHGYYKGAFLGLIAGLFMDVLSGGVIGIGALVKMAAGFSAGLLQKLIFKDNLLVPTLAVFLGTVIFESFNLLMHISFHANYRFSLLFVSAIFPLAVYNSLLAPILYYFLLRMEKYIAEREV